MFYKKFVILSLVVMAALSCAGCMKESLQTIEDNRVLGVWKIELTGVWKEEATKNQSADDSQSENAKPEEHLITIARKGANAYRCEGKDFNCDVNFSLRKFKDKTFAIGYIKGRLPEQAAHSKHSDSRVPSVVIVGRVSISDKSIILYTLSDYSIPQLYRRSDEGHTIVCFPSTPSEYEPLLAKYQDSFNEPAFVLSRKQ